LRITTTSGTWKRLATQKLNPAQALLTGDLQIDGGVLAVRRFLGFFDTD
jgi:putative sterol carrier protein